MTYLGFKITPKGADFQLWGIRSGVWATYEIYLGSYPTKASAEAEIAAINAAAPQASSYGPNGQPLEK